MPELIMNSTVFLRLTEHDGMPYSIIEALSYGRYVAFSQPFPAVKHISSVNDLCVWIKDLMLQHKQGVLKENLEGAEYVKQEFNEERTMKCLLEIFEQSILKHKER